MRWCSLTALININKLKEYGISGADAEKFVEKYSETYLAENPQTKGQWLGTMIRFAGCKSRAKVLHAVGRAGNHGAIMNRFALVFLASLLFISWGKVTIHLSPYISLSLGGTATSVIVPLFVAYLFIKRGHKARSLPISPISPIFLICVYCLVSIFWTRGYDFFFFNTVILPSLLGYIMLRDLLRCPDDFWKEKFLPFFTLSPLLIVARGLVDSPGILINEGKLDSPADHHTLVAMNLLMMIPLIAGMLIHDEKRKLTYGIYLVLAIMGVIMCGSRVGLVVLFVVLMLGIFLFAGKSMRIIGFLAIIVTVIFLFALPMTHQRFSGLLSLGNDDYLITRTLIWDRTFIFIKEHLLLGVGFSQKTFKAMGIERYGYQNGEPVFFYEHPHNLYLQVIAFLGIAGTALFIWLILDMGKKLSRLEKGQGSSAFLAKALILGFLGFMVMNLVEGALNSGRMMLNLFLICALIDHLSGEEASTTIHLSSS